MDFFLDPFSVLDRDDIRVLLDGCSISGINVMLEGGVAFDVLEGCGQDIFVLVEELVDFLLLVGGEVSSKLVGELALFGSSIIHCGDFLGPDCIDACRSKTVGSSGGVSDGLGDLVEFSLVNWHEEDLGESVSCEESEGLSLGGIVQDDLGWTGVA